MSGHPVSTAETLKRSETSKESGKLQKITMVAVYEGHEEAEKTVRKLQQSGFDMRKLSIVGKDYNTEEKVVGYYNDR